MPILLLAQISKMGRRLCTRVRNLPRVEDLHTSDQGTALQIPVPSEAKLFEQVAMDLITGLLQIGKHNAILTIVNHRCLRVAIFLPVSDTITGAGIAMLYMDYIY